MMGNVQNINGRRKLMLASLLTGLAGCGPSSCETESQRKKREDEAEIAKINKANSFFRSQIILDSAFSVANIPFLVNSKVDDRIHREWIGPHDWSAPSARVNFGLVNISPGLLQAALNLWETENPNVSSDVLTRAKNDLYTKYYNTSQFRCFMFFVVPDFKDRAWYRVHVDPNKQNSILYTLSSRSQFLKREPFLQEPVPGWVGSDHCLVYFAPFTESADSARIYVDINDVNFSALRYDGTWNTTAMPRSLRFRFESGEVRLLSMIQNGVSWASINNRLLEPKTIDHQQILGVAFEAILGAVVKVVAKSILRI